MNGKKVILSLIKCLFLFIGLLIAVSIVLKRIDSYLFNEFELLTFFGVGCMVLGSEIKTIQILYLYYKEAKKCNQECSNCSCHEEKE
ncbi:hypothetical protein [Clostridium disporicum]|uniref:hypothetical protein n=1 Tax=Clostridium disporicum TaxID=84024 RepID=UPI0034A441EC